jgi:aconitase (EC 4.2.1.3)
LDKAPIIEYMRSNITLMKWMIANGYSDARTLGRRIKAMEAWIANPQLLKADPGAEYAAVIEIDLADIKEPIVACPNDPDDVKLLSEVAGDKIDEVFIGSCMTNIGHFRAAGKVLDGKSDIPTRLWIAPPTKMDAMILNEEGYYGVLGKSGARMEMPGCSLCMGNQAQIRKGSTAMSTSTQLPQPPRHRHPRLSGFGRAGRGVRADGQDPDRAGVHGAGGGGEQEGRRHLPLHELRPDRGIPRGCGYGGSLKR